MPLIARIALNRPLRRLFDYIIPEDLELTPGQRVRIPFGRQQATGLVVQVGVEPPPGITLKAVAGAMENWPALPVETFKLLSWASDYYQHPLGECLFTALPPALRRGRIAEEKKDQWWLAIDSGSTIPANAHKQKALWDWLNQRSNGAPTTDILRAGFNRAQLKALQEKQLIEVVSPARPADFNEAPELLARRPRLSEAQTSAAE